MAENYQVAPLAPPSSCHNPSVFYHIPSYMIVYSKEDDCRGWSMEVNHSWWLSLRSKGEPKKTPNQIRIQLHNGKWFLLRGGELLCTCYFGWKLHSCKLTDLLYKLSLLNAILSYTLYLLMSATITGPNTLQSNVDLVQQKKIFKSHHYNRWCSKQMQWWVSALLRAFVTNDVPSMHLRNVEVQYWTFPTAKMAASNIPPSQRSVKSFEILARVPAISISKQNHRSLGVQSWQKKLYIIFILVYDIHLFHFFIRN